MQQSRVAGAGVAELRLRLAADAASVRGARQFVADGLREWGMDELLGDATLCVSELAGNAALHSGSTFMEIGLRSLEDAVRITVEDDGQVPTEAVGVLAPLPDSARSVLLPEEQPTTGRGLVIVSILASDWGIQRTENGKRVWADIGAGDGHATPPERDDETGDPSANVLPDGWASVRLAGCPVQLSLRQDEHLDELVREFQLLAADRDNPQSRALATEIQGLLAGPAHARHTGRRIAQEAAAAGHEYVDVDMAMPEGYAAEVLALQAAVRAADVLCEEMQLLTLASPPELRAFRAWMTEQIVGQLEQQAEPVSWLEWLDRHGDVG